MRVGIYLYSPVCPLNGRLLSPVKDIGQRIPARAAPAGINVFIYAMAAAMVVSCSIFAGVMPAIRLSSFARLSWLLIP